METTADQFASRLYRKGWSAGDAAFDDANGRRWLVYCHRSGLAIKGEGATQTDAWQDACEKLAALEN